MAYPEAVENLVVLEFAVLVSLLVSFSLDLAALAHHSAARMVQKDKNPYHLAILALSLPKARLALVTLA